MARRCGVERAKYRAALAENAELAACQARHEQRVATAHPVAEQLGAIETALVCTVGPSAEPSR